MQPKPYDIESWQWILPGECAPLPTRFDPKIYPICMYIASESGDTWTALVRLFNGQEIRVAAK